MKKLVLIIVTVLFLQSCSNEPEASNHPGNASQVAFSLKDAQGNDLLNPNHSNYYNVDSVKIYSTEGVLMNTPIYVYKDDRPVINAFIYGVNNFCTDQEMMQDMYCKRYWHWNENEVDTVEVFLKDNNYRIDSYKFKVNGVEYNLETMPTRIIQLTK